jgi:hypothetical protein
MKPTEEEDHPAWVYKTKVWISCWVAELLAVLDFGFIKKDSKMLSIAKGLGSNHLMWSKNLIVVNGKFLSMIVSTTCNAWGVLWNSGCQACKGGLEIIETRRWRNHWRLPRYCVFHDHVDIGNESHICSDLWISTVMLIPKFEENLLHFFQALIRKASRFSYVLSSHWYEWFSVPDIENLTRLEIEGVEVKFCTEKNVDRGAFDSYNLWCPA